MNRSLVVAVLVAGAATTLFVLFSRRDARSQQGSSPNGQAADHSQRPSLAGAQREGIPHATAGERIVDRVEVESSSAAQKGESWELQGRIKGLQCLQYKDLHLLVRGAGTELLSIPLDESGSFSTDVTHILKSKKAIEWELRVQQTLIESGRLYRREARAIPTDNHRVLTLVLRADGCAVVTGTAQDEHFAALSNAEVGVFAVSGQRVMLAKTRTDVGGAFRISGLPTDDVFLVVQRRGLRPSTTRAALSPGENDLGITILRESAAVSGNLATSNPSLRSSVLVRRMPGAPEGQFFVWGDSSFRWIDDRLEYYTLIAAIEDESFRVAGLERGATYEITSNPIGCASVPGVPGSARARVIAPAEGLDLVVTSPVLAVRVVDAAGEAIGRAWVEVLDGGTAWGCETDSHGWSRIVVRPEVDYEIRIVEPGYKTAQLTLRSPRESGIVETTATLEPETAPGELLLTPREGLSLEIIEVVLTPEGSEGSSIRQRVRRAEFGFRVERIPSGVYSIHVSEDVDPTRPAGFLLPIQTRQTIAPGETSHQELWMESGGRIEVRIVDIEGKELAGRCTIRDEIGDAIEVRFAAVDRDQNVAFQHDSIPHCAPGVRGFVPLLNPLRPGPYTIQVELEGFAHAERPIEVRQLAVERVLIELKAE